MMILIFGWMLIGSLFILLGWGRQGWRKRVPRTVYNAGLMLALGMDLHAIGMMMTLYGRLEQIIADGASFATDDPVYFVGTALVVIAKSIFVWIAAMGEGRTYSRKFWWSYVTAMICIPPAVWSYLTCN